MFVAVDTHIRDSAETNNTSPISFPRQSATMLIDGLFEYHVKDGLLSSSLLSYTL